MRLQALLKVVPGLGKTVFRTARGRCRRDRCGALARPTVLAGDLSLLCLPYASPVAPKTGERETDAFLPATRWPRTFALAPRWRRSGSRQSRTLLIRRSRHIRSSKREATWRAGRLSEQRGYPRDRAFCGSSAKCRALWQSDTGTPLRPGTLAPVPRRFRIVRTTRSDRPSREGASPYVNVD
jgi:hypothetical protein